MQRILIRNVTAVQKKDTGLGIPKRIVLRKWGELETTTIRSVIWISLWYPFCWPFESLWRWSLCWSSLSEISSSLSKPWLNVSRVTISSSSDTTSKGVVVVKLLVKATKYIAKQVIIIVGKCWILVSKHDTHPLKVGMQFNFVHSYVGTARSWAYMGRYLIEVSHDQFIMSFRWVYAPWKET